jgi:hypothetical protein
MTNALYYEKTAIIPDFVYKNLKLEVIIFIEKGFR